MPESDDPPKRTPLENLPLKKLTAAQVKRIDEMIASIGDYGEVQLIIQHGELRYINRVQSYKAWNNSEDGYNQDST